MNEELKNNIIEICSSTMWINEDQQERLLELVEKNGWRMEDVKNLLEKEDERIKKRFLKTFQGVGDKKYYHVLAKKIFPVGEKSTVTIGRKYVCQKIVGRYKIVVVPYYEYPIKSGQEYVPFSCEVSAIDQKINFDYVFDHEDMYRITVYLLMDDAEYLFMTTCVYAVESDLYNLQYYKADLHTHSTFSDGYDTPEMVVLSARNAGMDVLAITDHNNFRGSVVAKEFVDNIGVDMTIIHGEEYSLDYSPMHILALGTKEPVDRFFLGTEVLESQRAKQMLDSIGDISCDKKAYIATQILLGEVRKLNGVTVLAHPYWKPIALSGSRKDTPESLFRELAKNRRFDGIELVSGSAKKEYGTSMMQAAFAQNIIGSLEDIPVIGITDSHRYSTDPISGGHFTVIFAKDREEESIIEALKTGKSVAVEMVEGIPQLYGKFRYIKFAQFLVGYYFRERDEEAMKEAMILEEKLYCKE